MISLMQDSRFENRIASTQRTGVHQVLPAAQQASTKRSRDLAAAAQDFEALLAVFLVRSLRQAMSPNGFYSSGYGGTLFQGMMEEVLAQTLAARERLGIAEALEKQLGASSRSPVNRRSVAEETAYSTYIEAAAQRHALDADLLRAVIRHESGGNPRALSPRGAAGLMQLMPETAIRLDVADRFDPQQNIEGGARYLSELLRRFGQLESALAAYNAGPAAVEKYQGVPPIAETRTFVQRVLASYRTLSTRNDKTTKSSREEGGQ